MYKRLAAYEDTVALMHKSDSEGFCVAFGEEEGIWSAVNTIFNQIGLPQICFSLLSNPPLMVGSRSLFCFAFHSSHPFIPHLPVLREMALLHLSLCFHCTGVV